jgi:hypothetical protein
LGPAKRQWWAFRVKPDHREIQTKDVIEIWLAYKREREREVDAIRLRPHPYEFHLYYDI